MPAIIILDTGPLSNAAVSFGPSGKTPTLSQQCRHWLRDCDQRGARVLVPAISYYESLRELERRGASAQIARLKAFVFQQPNRFLPLTTAHLEAAAKLWGVSRNTGLPTASEVSLDGDVILAAQALSLGLAPSDYIVAMTNTGHLSRFVPSDLWTNITP